jgi:pimeloyl-ACP methyl ester carboxylesterase
VAVRAATGLLTLVLLFDSFLVRADQARQVPLSVLVHEYIATSDTGKADQLLSEILAREDATVPAISSLLAAGREYKNEPLGLQPGREIVVGQRTFEYGLYVPPGYRPQQAYGLVVCLHGAGFTGDSYLERWQTRLGDDYILACPTFMHGDWWTRSAEDLVLATMRAVASAYHIDPDRIFLTGMSNGGIGAYLIGAHHAARFAAVIPMAGGLDRVLMPFLENLRHTPLYIIHGKQDQVMPVELSRSIVDTLKELGYRYVYREHDRVHPVAGGHFFPREELPELVAWLGRQHREPYPKTITVVRDASHLLPFAWVRIDATDRIASFSEELVDHQDDAIRNRLYARVEAEIQADNRIVVRSRRVRRYTLFLNDELLDFSRPVTVVTNDVVTQMGPVRPSAQTLLRGARVRQDPRALYPVSLTIDVPGT